MPGTGGELAEHLLAHHGLTGVRVEQTDHGGDHYDPEARCVRLSPRNYAGKSLTAVGPNHFSGSIELGVGVVKGLFDANVRMQDLEPPRALRLSGRADGSLGASTGEAQDKVAEHLVVK